MVKIDILHPIEHDGKRFERGVVEVAEELAKLFLSFKNTAAPQGVAKEVKAAPATAAETARPAPAAKAANGTATPQPAPAKKAN